MAPSNRRNVNGSVKCPHCDWRCSATTSLMGHINTEHQEGHGYQCGVCPLWFKDRTNMKRHKRTVHEPKMAWWCTNCKKAVGARRDNAMRHRAKHPDLCQVEQVTPERLVALESGQQDNSLQATVAPATPQLQEGQQEPTPDSNTPALLGQTSLLTGEQEPIWEPLLGPIDPMLMQWAEVEQEQKQEEQQQQQQLWVGADPMISGIPFVSPPLTPPVPVEQPSTIDPAMLNSYAETASRDTITDGDLNMNWGQDFDMGVMSDPLMEQYEALRSSHPYREGCDCNDCFLARYVASSA